MEGMEGRGGEVGGYYGVENGGGSDGMDGSENGVGGWES